MGVWGVMLCALLLSGCGYGFSGSGGFPGGVQRIFVAQVTDKVGEAGLGTRLTDDLVYVLMRSPQGKLADSAQNADAFLEGEVRSLSQTALARTASDKDIERRISLTGFFVLRSLNGAILWQREVQESEVYAVGRDKASTASNRRDALETLVLRMAENVVERMGDDF
jgi:outer membrane lipopolysaccharide assembly protein LptE/RlpB